MKIMKQKTFIAALFAGLVLVSSCASKKELDNCRLENKNLTESFQSTKEELAASRARVNSLEEQLAQQKKDYASLQNSLDKSLLNSNANNVNISKVINISAIWLK